MREYILFVFKVKLNCIAVGNITVNILAKDYLTAVCKLQSIIKCDKYELLIQKRVKIKDSPYALTKYKKIYSPKGS